MYKVGELKPKDDEEYNAWKELQAYNIVPINKYIHNVDVNIIEPFSYSVVTDTEIPLYMCASNSKFGNIGNFKGATCSKFRADGEMVVVGTKDGHILLLAIAKMGNIIRKLLAHDGAINKIEYLYKFELVQKKTASVGDDGTLQIWDINDQSMLHKFADSKQPLKSLAVHKTESDIVATGSVDGFIRLYNIGTNTSPIVSINTQMSVNCLTFPWETRSEMILSAGQSSIQLWNATNHRVNDDNLPVALFKKTPHHMQIVDLAVSDGLYSGETVVFTAGLDGLVKVISLGDFREIFKYEYPSSLVAIRVLPHSQYLIVAGNDTSDNTKGHIYTRKLRTGESSAKPETKLQRCQGIEHQTILRLADKFNDENKVMNVIDHNTKDKLTRFDTLIRKHKHKTAFNFALAQSHGDRPPEYWQKIIRELDCLGALKKVVALRSERELTTLFKVLRKHIWMPRFTNTYLRLLNVILSAYPYKELMNNREFIRLRKTMTMAVDKYRHLERTSVNIKNLLVSCESNTPESFAKLDYGFSEQMGTF